MAENLLSVQQYAVKHKLSTFAVVKLVNAKKIHTIKRTIDGEEKEFIVEENNTPSFSKPKEESTPLQTSINYEVEFHKLLAKHLELQTKYDAMIEKMANL